MAILSTNQKLIKVSVDYSAGNGIDITSGVISVTGDNAPYSAGDNIDIQDHIISGKDWSNDIEQASANAYNVTTAWVQDNYANSADMTYISAMVDTKLDTSAWSSVSGDLATESYVIMADNINYAQATAYVENQNYANKDFVLANIDSATSGKLDSSSFASVSGDFLTTAFGISESGAWNEATNCVENNSAAWFDNQGDVEVNELVYAQSANWNEISSKLDSTAFDTWQQGQYTNDIAGLNNLIGTKLDASSFEETSGTFYPTSNPSGFITGVDLTPYYTTAEANTLSSMLSGAIDYVSANADDPEVTNLVQTNSGVWNEVTSKLDTTAFSDVSGNFYTNDNPSGFITGVDLSNYYTKDETSGKEELANAFANIPVGDPEVNAYVTSNSASIDESTDLVQSNSSTWNDVTAYQSNSGIYLTAHQDISNKLDTTAFGTVSGDFLTTSFGISESATWDDVSETVQTNSSVWNDKLDSSSLDLEIGQHYDFDPGITGAYKISGADILASNALADSKGRVITGWYQLKDDNLLSGTKYGTLKIDNENTHLVDTTFSALSSYDGILASAIPASGVGYYTPVGYQDTTQSTTSHSYDNVKSYSINLQSWDGGFTAQINGTNYDHSYFDGSHTITGEFNTPSTLVVNLYRSNNYMQPTIKQFDLGVAGEINEVVDIRNVFATNEQLNTASSYLSGAIDYVSANAGGTDLVHKSDFTFVTDQWGTYLQKVSGKYIDYATRAGQAERDQNGHEITAQYFTTANANTLSSMFSAAIDYVSANVGGGGGNPEVENYVVSNSSKIDEVVSTYQGFSGTYLTAVDLSPYYTTADANTLSSMLSGAIDYVSANAGGTDYYETAVTSTQDFVVEQPGQVQSGDGNLHYSNIISTIYKTNDIVATALGFENLNNAKIYANFSNVTSYNISYPAIYLSGTLNGNDTYGGWNFNNTAAFTAALLNGINLTDISSRGDVSRAGDDIPDNILGVYFITTTNKSTITAKTVPFTASITSPGTTISLTSLYDSIPETSGFVPLSSFNELKQSYDALSSLFATYSGQWLLPNEGV